MLIINALALSAKVAEYKDSIGVTKINGRLHIRYMVAPGETIYRISTKNKISIADLMEINPELEFGLKTGQIINIPYEPDKIEQQVENAVVKYVKPDPANTDSITSNGVLHTVQQGETYSSLSKKYNLSVEQLLKMNSTELKPGQKIIVNNTIKSQPTAEPKPDAPKTIPPKSEPAKPQQAAIDNAATDLSTVPEEPIAYDNTKKQLLIIPFDPYLYFSDADDEIAAGSKINRTKVRQAFRRRLNALLEPPGYETIHLLGGKAKDSITDLNKIYSSVTYNYQDILESEYNPRITKTQGDPALATQKSWFDKQKDKLSASQNDNTKKQKNADSNKYFGVKINNAAFYTYFNNKYKVDYYLFINQFEVKTNYDNCLDRATLNYERGFITHYSIFDKAGKQVAGNRIYTDYNSNTNQIQKILSDNMQKVADRIMSDLPKP
ncbi:MAG: LysM peptidoglycan-binding domain-containing protein [Cytophagales bacterium]|nr:LysM peptidoglycan-binding domain-containing protein [Cytophagales bacterium]